jgi:hypothetical protein
MFKLTTAKGFLTDSNAISFAVLCLMVHSEFREVQNFLLAKEASNIFLSNEEFRRLFLVAGWHSVE